MNADSYLTIDQSSEGLYKEKGSKFIAYLHPFSSIDQLKDYLLASRKNHPKSRHHCYAYSLGINGEPAAFSDDGEPGGSAGRPILGQIRSANLSDCLIIVVRYFGGTKLGVPGLINAYKLASLDAIQNNKIITKQLMHHYELIGQYPKMGLIMDAFKKSQIEITHKSFEIDIRVQFQIPQSKSEEVLHKLKAYLLGIPPKELLTEIPLEEIEIIELT